MVGAGRRFTVRDLRDGLDLDDNWRSFFIDNPVYQT